MEIEKIEGYVRCLLESWALHEDGEERVVWETLHTGGEMAQAFSVFNCDQI